MRRFSTISVFISILFLVLAGCHTKYKRSGSVERYDEDVFQVSFRSNAFTSAKRTAAYALLRCAETTLENGYNYFQIVDGDDKIHRSSYTSPVRYKTTYTGTYNTIGNTGYSQGSATTKKYGGRTTHFEKPESIRIIKCFREKPDFFVYNAAYVQSEIRKKYKIK